MGEAASRTLNLIPASRTSKRPTCTLDVRKLGSVQLINDRCVEMQRSKHGSCRRPRPLGPSCSPRRCWEWRGEWLQGCGKRWE